MFEAAELGSTVAKEVFEARLPGLRVELVNAQYDLRHADFPVVVLLTGDDRVGVNETLNVLHEWMDARYIQTTVFGAEREEERERPRFWRYWHALPRKGQLAILVGDWSTALLADRIVRSDRRRGVRARPRSRRTPRAEARRRRRADPEVLAPPAQEGTAAPLEEGEEGRRSGCSAPRTWIAASTSATTRSSRWPSG